MICLFRSGSVVANHSSGVISDISHFTSQKCKSHDLESFLCVDLIVYFMFQILPVTVKIFPSVSDLDNTNFMFLVGVPS